MSDRFLVAIPVFNEERYLDRVIAEVRRYTRNILIIDDGSTDETPQKLQPHKDIAIITHAENRGYGKSLADAFCFASRQPYDWLITMDCDEQHEPEQIPRFIEVAQQDNADIISGTRYPSGQKVEASVPQDRKEINHRITAMLNRRLGLNITDSFCGFKAYRVSALSNINITVPGYAMPMQFWVQAQRADLHITEIPVRLIYNDPNRHFGGLLDDPDARLQHYLEVFESEMKRSAVPCSSQSDQPGHKQTECQPCR